MQHQEFEQNVDFIPLDFETGSEEFDNETIRQLQALQDAATSTDNVQPAVNFSDLVRPETMNQPVPSYIPSTEYDKDGNKIEYIVIESDDEMEDIETIEINSDEEGQHVPSEARLPMKRKRVVDKSDRPRIECFQCHVAYNSNNPLTHIARPEKLNEVYFCVGCTRLFSCTSSPQEAYDMFQWFATGRLPHYDLPPTLTMEQFHSRFKHRCSYIRARTRNNNMNSDVDTMGLLQLYEESDFRCKFSNLPVFLHDMYRNRLPYWALSVDHVIPISTARTSHETYNIGNMQITCSCLNTVKGHYSDEQLMEWFNAFRESIQREVEV